MRVLGAVLVVLALLSAGWVVRGWAVETVEGVNEQQIQGTWRAAGAMDKNHSWFMQWNFQLGSFTQVGYPPLNQSGKYRVVKADAEILTLELFEQRGTFGTQDSSLVIVVHADTDWLDIGALKNFRRQK